MKPMSEEYDPEKVVGVPYQRGLLPYGGGVGPDGRVVFARSREVAERRVLKMPGTHSMSKKNLFWISLLFFPAEKN